SQVLAFFVTQLLHHYTLSRAGVTLNLLLRENKRAKVLFSDIC
ncbi:MAG: hypothetical protein RLZZ29_513, partial [Cyanobacteriota bacterium]